MKWTNSWRTERKREEWKGKGERVNLEMAWKWFWLQQKSMLHSLRLSGNDFSTAFRYHCHRRRQTATTMNERITMMMMISFAYNLHCGKWKWACSCFLSHQTNIEPHIFAFLVFHRKWRSRKNGRQELRFLSMCVYAVCIAWWWFPKWWWRVSIIIIIIRYGRKQTQFENFSAENTGAVGKSNTNMKLSTTSHTAYLWNFIPMPLARKHMITSLYICSASCTNVIINFCGLFCHSLWLCLRDWVSECLCALLYSSSFVSVCSAPFHYILYPLL